MISGIAVALYFLPEFFYLNTDGNSSAHDHVYGEWQIMKPARFFLFGEKYRVCTECGHSDYSLIVFPTLTHYLNAIGAIIVIVLIIRLLWKSEKIRFRTTPYYSESDLVFSTIHGNGVYELVDEAYFDPLNPKSDHKKSYILRNINTKEEFFAEAIGLQEQNRYAELVMMPVSRKEILWPFDIAVSSRNDLSDISVMTYYSDIPWEDKRKTKAFVLFPVNGYGNMINTETWLRKLSHSANWNNARVMEYIKSLLLIISGLNHAGYLYYDFHMDKVLVDQEDHVMLNFSHLIFSQNPSDDKRVSQDLSRYPIETAEPATYARKNKTLDVQCQNYSLCAYLFRIMFNRWPYDGRLLDYLSDINPQEHYTKYRKYQEMPVFIFDPSDDRNQLGTFTEELALIELWEKCPEIVKEEFIRILCWDNAQRTKEPYSRSADEWLSLLSQAGLIKLTNSK